MSHLCGVKQLFKYFFCFFCLYLFKSLVFPMCAPSLNRFSSNNDLFFLEFFWHGVFVETMRHLLFLFFLP